MWHLKVAKQEWTRVSQVGDLQRNASFAPGGDGDLFTRPAFDAASRAPAVVENSFVFVDRDFHVLHEIHLEGKGMATGTRRTHSSCIVPDPVRSGDLLTGKGGTVYAVAGSSVWRLRLDLNEKAVALGKKMQELNDKFMN